MRIDHAAATRTTGRSRQVARRFPQICRGRLSLVDHKRIAARVACKMKILLWLLTLAAGGYGAVATLMYFGQRSLLYFPEESRTAPAAAGLPGADEVVLDTSDGEQVIVWHRPPQAGHPVVLYFHGNGGSLRIRATRLAALTSDGTGLVALSYRGFGGSTGSPTEDGLIRDATAAYRFAAERYGANRIVLWGESLGTGVAVAIAADHPVAGVILESPFTSTADVAAAVYWFMPVRLLMKDQFHSDARIARVTAPVLIMHGARDATVPIGYAEELFGMVTAPKHFVRFPDGAHNNLDAFGALDAVRAFLCKL
jgi:pimeloyl-ACP methyl ester carboxylesterase